MSPIPLSLKQSAPALKKGIVDCAITGAMSAYTDKLYEVAAYGFTLRIGWGLAFGAINMNKWNLLTKTQKAILSTEISVLNENMWQETATEGDIALSCLPVDHAASVKQAT